MIDTELVSIKGSGNMDFSEALRLLKMGKKLARSGWNGRGMWITMSPGHPGLPAENFWSEANKEHAFAMGGLASVNPCITMKGADGSITMGWVAAQTDLFAEDWGVVD